MIPKCIKNKQLENRVKKLESGEMYLTDEVRIGTWIDGKPLYRRVVTGTLPEPDIGGSNWIYLFNNVSNLVNIYGIIDQRPYNAYSILRNNLYILALDFAVLGGTSLAYRNLGYVVDSKFEITIEYTKTTD